jgi:hypothetical protein
MSGGKMQADGDRQNAVDADDAALDARRADAGKELDSIKQQPGTISSVTMSSHGWIRRTRHGVACRPQSSVAG